MKKLTETQALIDSEGKMLNLAAALYICTKDEVYYLSSGSNPKYNQFMGAYRLQWEMIEYAKNTISHVIIFMVLQEISVIMQKTMVCSNLKRI